MEMERQFIQSFALRNRAERYLQLLAVPKRRAAFLDILNHRFEYDPRFAHLTASFADLGPGSKIVHVIADGHPLDSMDVALSVAEDQLSVHMFGYIVIADPGRLALYQPEAPSSAILLTR